jgi:hypothetical protein
MEPKGANPVRIVVGVVPVMLREILMTVLRAEPGFEVTNLGDGFAAAGTSHPAPDLVVTMIDDGVPDVFRELFRVHPGLRLLGLKEQARGAYLVELQPYQLSLGELSPEDLVAAIREAAQRPDFVASLAGM